MIFMTQLRKEISIFWSFLIQAAITFCQNTFCIWNEQMLCFWFGSLLSSCAHHIVRVLSVSLSLSVSSCSYSCFACTLFCIVCFWYFSDFIVQLSIHWIKFHLLHTLHLVWYTHTFQGVKLNSIVTRYLLKCQSIIKSTQWASFHYEVIYLYGDFSL